MANLYCDSTNEELCSTSVEKTNFQKSSVENLFITHEKILIIIIKKSTYNLNQIDFNTLIKSSPFY